MIIIYLININYLINLINYLLIKMHSLSSYIKIFNQNEILYLSGYYIKNKEAKQLIKCFKS